MKYFIKEQECGYLLKNGMLQGLLFAGKHTIHSFLGYELRIVSMVGKVDTKKLPAKLLMEQPEFAKRVVRVRIPDHCIGIHLVDGIYKEILMDGEALYWNVFEENEIRLVDVTGIQMTEEQVPGMYRHLIPTRFYKRVVIGEGETGLLYIDGHFDRELSCGTYFYWNYAHEVSCKVFNLKVQQLDISGQEILTADKVGIRLNILCTYRITNPLELVKKLEGASKLLYTRVQLAAREYVGQFRLDELLADKEAIGTVLKERLLEVQKAYCVEVLEVGIKDIILPGEIRDIMNTVLVAEKKAQANVIMRREEVASTRSLMNTAKLMEENPVLYRLKELEYLERICDKVGSISVNGGGNLLEQLAGLVVPEGNG
ncbi:MAG: slipin family protein [Lachnospiraceae bacterium]|jgi:regulator of protease activity HflC (stomatin/prohibitin superfamily)|nr:slipin family protein [Lachnospiraceae bacterium]